MNPNSAKVLSFNTKWYFNTPEMLRRLGKWRNDTLARVGAYGRGVFRNTLGRPQKKQTKERTVNANVRLYNRKTNQYYLYQKIVFVPRIGPIVEKGSNRIVPLEVARYALAIVSQRVRGQGAGKPPRMGRFKILRHLNEFALDPQYESVVIGTIPLPKRVPIAAASVPEMLDQGLKGFINNSILPLGTVFTEYAEHPYVLSTMPRTIAKMNRIIQQNPAGK